MIGLVLMCLLFSGITGLTVGVARWFRDQEKS